MENPGPRDLRCDQECRHDGGEAYQPEKLIHRKHRHRPQRQPNLQEQSFKEATSIRRFCSLLRARHELIGVNRPANREQRQNRNDGQGFHGFMVVLDCGQKRQSLVHFRDEQQKNHGSRGARAFAYAQAA
jgi:hypothetical protein